MKKHIDYHKYVDDAIQLKNPGDADIALDYLDCVEDQKILKAYVIGRYGTALRREIKEDGTAGYEQYYHGAIKEAIEKGLIELVLSHSYQRIVQTTACLFTQSHSFDFEGPTGDTVEEVEEIITDYRTRGRAKQQFVRADRLAMALGSSILRLGWRAPDRITYEAIPPQCIWIVMADRIEDTEYGARAVDRQDIEDASAVVLQLASQLTSTGTRQRTYIAYIGRCEEYPEGRCVTYQGADWQPIPVPGSKEILEECRQAEEGEICNPLTWLSATIEYPVSILLGSDQAVSLLTDTGLSLFQNCIEIDIAKSRVLTAAVEAARGLKIIKDPTGAGAPTSLFGAVVLHQGQELIFGGIPAAEAESAMRTINAISRSLAESYSVPGFLVDISNTNTPESGYALSIQYRPLIEKRRERAELNETAVERIYQIERALHNAYAGGIEIGDEITQHYYLGDYEIPVNPTEELALLKEQKAMGLVDDVEICMSLWDLTEDEARQYLERIRAREAELPPSSAQESANPMAALFRRRQQSMARIPPARDQVTE